MSSSIEKFMDSIISKNPDQPEFHQAVHEVVDSIWDFLNERSWFLFFGIPVPTLPELFSRW